jgi:hypothetical protein
VLDFDDHLPGFGLGVGVDSGDGEDRPGRDTYSFELGQPFRCRVLAEIIRE